MLKYVGFLDIVSWEEVVKINPALRGKSMPYQVKVYDGEGNLLRTIQPEFDATSKPSRKFVTHPCPTCKDSTSNKKYCSKCILDREERKPAQ